MSEKAKKLAKKRTEARRLYKSDNTISAADIVLKLVVSRQQAAAWLKSFRKEAADVPELPRQEQVFCEEYASRFSATRAAIAAGLESTDGYRLLRRKDIQQAIKDIRAERQRVAVRAEAIDIIREYQRIAFNGEKEADRVKALKELERFAGIQTWQEEVARQKLSLEQQELDKLKGATVILVDNIPEQPSATEYDSDLYDPELLADDEVEPDAED